MKEDNKQAERNPFVNKTGENVVEISKKIFEEEEAKMRSSPEICKEENNEGESNISIIV